MFRHPKYYKELRKLRNKLDQTISASGSYGLTKRVRSGPGPKQQATRFKPRAASIKLQAASFKLQDLRTTKKFHGARTEGLNADESIVWMLNVKGNLVWRKFNLVTLRNF